MNPQKYERQKDLLRGSIYYNCIKRGDFTLSSGIKTNTFIDLQEYVSLNPMVFNLACKVLKHIVDPNICDFIMGVPHGGNLYAIPVAQLLLKPFVFLKSKCKVPESWGSKPFGDQYETIRDQNYILIEDVVTTGKSCEDVIELYEPIR